MTYQTEGCYFRTPLNSDELVRFVESRVGPTQLVGPNHLILEGTCDSRSGGQRQVVFTTRDDYADGVALKDSLVLIERVPDDARASTNQYCIVADPRAIFIDLLTWIIDTVGVDAHRRGFQQSAMISKDAQVSKSAFVERGVEIGAGSVISAGVVIKSGTRIGKHTVIRENAVIGSVGVTVYRAIDGRLLKFPHVGGVTIGDNTEIGANVVVAGGVLSPTIIGDEVVMGNLCNIGHGAIVKNGVWMSVGTLVGGHTRIDAGATIAMGVTVRDNLIIGPGASLGMGSVVVKHVEAGRSMFGNPAKRTAALKTGPKR